MSYATTDIIEHSKQRGEWAELLFMARAAEHGLSILRPWGDSSPYDIAIAHGGTLLRVQIKSTLCRHSAGAYKCHIDSNKVPYRPGLLDFIAAYVIPAEVWYIVPFDATPYLYSSTYAGAFPTTVSNALNQSTTNVYDFNTGLKTSVTDPNN